MPPGAASSPAIEHVIGTFPRAELSAALAATHRAGFGPQTRVFDGARGDTGRQLERAGLRMLDGAVPPADAVLIVVTAPGRTAVVAEALRATRGGVDPPCRAGWRRQPACSGARVDATGHSHQRRGGGFRDLASVSFLAGQFGVSVTSVCPDLIDRSTSESRPRSIALPRTRRFGARHPGSGCCEASRRRPSAR